jgi:Xaa-Pro aminopeptidase
VFSPDFFRQNRERLRTLFTGTAPIVLTASGLLQRNSDTTYPFRQDGSFWYLTGIREPDIMLVLDKGKEYLIVPDREASREAFDGGLDFEQLAEQSGIEDVVDEKSGLRRLSSRLKKVQHAATLSAPPAFIQAHGIYTNPARARLISYIKEQASDSVELLDLRPHLTRMRSIKQEVELEAIQAAIDLTAKTLKQVHKKRDKYDHEYEVEADITAGFRKVGYGHAYEPIVASGANACTLHYVANSAPVRSDDFLLLDVGAEVEGYAADITRTFAVGQLDKRRQAVFDAVLEVQEFAKGELKPGVFLKEYEATVMQFMGEKLRELGLIKLIEKDEVRKYYPHATSHFMGLDVHDVADYERPLEPGMVLTVEPGIYIPEEGIGVRIEDDVLVTDGGKKILSEKLPVQL